MKKGTAIHWFRQDLRLSDNPALDSAAQYETLIPIYILDEVNSGEFKMGAASKWWLHQSLTKLNESLDGKLLVYQGNPHEILNKLIEEQEVSYVTWNRCYEPWRIDRDKEIKRNFEDKNVAVESFSASLLWEPWTISKDDGTPYRVFTPFYKKGCLNSEEPRLPAGKVDLSNLYSEDLSSDSITDLNLLPTIKWYKSFEEEWNPGEIGAEQNLNSFLDSGLLNYKEGRNFPSQEFVSRLSPHLHFGEISPNEVWYRAKTKEGISGIEKSLAHFHSELGWREFSYYLLYHFPDLPNKNFQEKFDIFPWQENEEFLALWQKGNTGYPIVDAGMRELWQTGYMHNRLRMIVGSFLVKNLLIDWRFGERWFWDCLVDADLASNSASWQWVAGSGADAAPYFRIFNPITQGLKFDPEGEYTKKYVPELRDLPNKYLFSPWEAPENILADAGIELGKNYPKPMVDLKLSRETALEAFATTKKENNE
ncbi:MAG: deoxyribodipyrimidine photo-lyase [Gammaproteobacteria bacterium]|jgi:deoxyribodipyrimidine photo-lyase|tara:strand:+ start:713 stop:2152 length:1440 start_codon:yes stop_codon:yes gene_type:complete